MDFLGEIKKTFVVLRRMLGKRKYLAITIISGFLFYLLNGFVVAHPRIVDFFQAYGIYAIWKILIVSLNYSYEILPMTFFGIILLSALIGTITALLTYRFDNFTDMRGGNFFATAGIFLGMAAPGCAACGVGLASLLGLSSILTILPYDGKEVLLMAVGASAISIFSISRKLYNPVCGVNSSSVKSEISRFVLGEKEFNDNEMKGGNKK